MAEKKQIGHWLRERALEHDRPLLLLQLLCERLHQQKIIRPGISLLERSVMTARQQAHAVTWEMIRPLLSKEDRKHLDQLLVVNQDFGLTPLTWYRTAATAHPAGAILETLKKIAQLRTAKLSDGQRFPVAVKTETATALPKYYGYGRGLTFYTWTSDQCSQWGTKPIPSTTRDATFVLDEVLDNETELPLLTHATDTAGYTELIFCLFDLLGYQFAPRLRDLGDQTLYRPDPDADFGAVNQLLTGRLHPEWFLDQWDEMLRLAGSLKMGWVTASLLISKLNAMPKHNTLIRAMQEYGRLIKTNFILRYLCNPEFQRQIHRQLNKGEALHSLRRYLMVAQEAQIRKRYPDDQLNQAHCLNLVTNAVVVWNTVYMWEVIEQLKREGRQIGEEDVKHLSPARYEHINVYGRYFFPIGEEMNRKGLRPLRKPGEED